MIIISHRGNLSGPEPDKENTPEHINAAMLVVGWCEIDLWVDEKTNELWLGHDLAETRIHPEFIKSKMTRLFVHCKNFLAMEWCRKNHVVHYFWHQEDDYTITSSGLFWMYPRRGGFNENTIIAMPELSGMNYQQQIEMYGSAKLYGICTDSAKWWQSYYEGVTW